MRPFALFIVVMGLLGCGFVRVQAQTLQLNETLTATLTTGNEDVYQIIAREGQVLSFVARSEDDLDTMLRVEDVNGRVFVSNDDYNYPDSRDAIIEAFVAPFTATYRVIVSGYGDTNGDYTLDMMTGYSQVVINTPFDVQDSWRSIDLQGMDTPTFAVVNGTANLAQAGIASMGMAVGATPDGDVYHVHAVVDSITDNAGWRTGLIFGYQDTSNFYRVLINYRGAWRIVAVRDGSETTIRDWNVHPAITPDTRSFTLGILVNGNHFDVFYDGQYIGSGDDPAFETGAIGFAVETIDTLGSEVTARYDAMTITKPTLVNASPIFPMSLVASGTNSTIRELQQRLLIPTNGEIAFVLDSSFAQNNSEGVTRIAVGDDRLFTNFAMAARVSWVASRADENGCGLVVRDDGTANYVLAYLDNEGGFGLSERSGNQFTQNSYVLREGSRQPPYNILLIVRDEMIHYYVDGEHAHSMTIGVRDGSIAEALINFEPVNTNCQFSNLWVYQW